MWKMLMADENTFHKYVEFSINVDIQSSYENTLLSQLAIVKYFA